MYTEEAMEQNSAKKFYAIQYFWIPKIHDDDKYNNEEDVYCAEA